MRVFNAGVYASGFNKTDGRVYKLLDDAERNARDTIEYILESYHYMYSKGDTPKKLRADNCKIFLDSGAFSFFSKGEEVSIDDYIQFIHQNEDIILNQDGIATYSVLDVIGSPSKTYDAQLYMESCGVKPLPCFHYGEDVSFLKKYLDNYEYITLGGMVPITTKQLHYWLDDLWGKYLCKEDGTARVKVHGFGLTTFSLMDKYPWFSVDSSSWVQKSLFGLIVIPPLLTLAVTYQSPLRKQLGAHLENIPPATLDYVLSVFDKYGFNIERIKTLYYSRWAFNSLMFYLEEQRIGEVKFKKNMDGFF